MHRPVHLALILCLVLTGIGLGAARGTAMQGGQVVICSGQGVVVMDHPATPERPHLCPDMALSVLAAMPVLPPDFAPAQDAARLGLSPRPLRAQGRESPVPAARDPPFRPISEPKSV